jgi:tRNA pseudouridine55 synthase
VLHMRVTAGFYVRSLAHDLGATLGMGAVLVGLRRTRSGEFGLEGAVPLADVLQAGREALAGRLLPFSGLLPELPAVTLRGPEQLARVKNGVEMGPGDVLVPISPLPELVRLLGHDGTLVALAKPATTAGFLHASIVF